LYAMERSAVKTIGWIRDVRLRLETDADVLDGSGEDGVGETGEGTRGVVLSVA